MKKVNFYEISDIDQLAWPESKEDISLDTPALQFFTDFNTVEPLVIDTVTRCIEVRNLMLQEHVKLKIVVDSNMHFLGIISLDRLDDRKIVQKVSEGFDRNDISVTDMMIPKNDLSAFDYNEISVASIGEIINALKDSGQRHCLVVDRESHKIRGIFSASDISRKLRLPIDIQGKSSFYKIFSVIHK